MDESTIALPVPEHAVYAVVRMEPGTPVRVLPEEEALLHPRSTESRRTAFRLGRTAAHQALEQLVGEHGPVLRGHHRQPLWPDGVVGSITHTDDIGVAIVAHAAHSGGVGVDIERRRPVRDIVAEFATSAELARLHRLPPQEFDAAALALFSAKETVYKAFYPRVHDFFGFEAVELEWHDPGRFFVARFTEPLDPAYPPESSFAVDCRRFGDLVATSLVLPPDR